jgi:hypothetical protein
MYMRLFQTGLRDLRTIGVLPTLRLLTYSTRYGSLRPAKEQVCNMCVPILQEQGACSPSLVVHTIQIHWLQVPGLDDIYVQNAWPLL